MRFINEAEHQQEAQSGVSGGEAGGKLQPKNLLKISNIQEGNDQAEELTPIYQPGHTQESYTVGKSVDDDTAFRQLIKKHLEKFGVDDPNASEKVFQTTKDVIEDHIRRQHADKAAKQFDLSSLVEKLETVDPQAAIMLKLAISEPAVGNFMALPKEDAVQVSYDGNLGIITIEGEKAAVQEFVNTLYFHADVNQLKHFWIDIKAQVSDGSQNESWLHSNAMAAQDQTDDSPITLLSAKVFMFYEPTSGFYVAQRPSVSVGTAQIEQDLVQLTTPEGKQYEVPFSRLPEQHRSFFEQATEIAENDNDILFSDRPIEPIDPVEPEPIEPDPVDPIEPDPIEPEPIDPIVPLHPLVNKPGEVTFVDTLPVASDDAYTTDLNTALVIDATNGATGLLDNDSDQDGDPLTITACDAVSANGGTIVDNLDGTYTYTPAAFYNGTDTFTYTIEDDDSNPSTATVSITVNPGQTVLTASLVDNLEPTPANESFSGTAANWHGTDTVDGGTGNDTLTITSGSVAITIDAASYTLFEEVETLVLPDATHSITMDDDYFDRGAGPNGNQFTINGSASNQAITIDASGVADNTHTLNITTGSGNDTISSGVGNDTVDAGGGTDRLNWGGTLAKVETFDGTNSITAVEYVNLSGNDNAHNLTFTDGYYAAGSGITGGEVTIDFSGATTGVTVNGGALTAPNELNVLGSDGNDSLVGGAGADTLAGNAGNDEISGGAGNDTISVNWNNTGAVGSPVAGNLVMHLDASNTGQVTSATGNVTLWTDGSGSGNNAFTDTGNPTSGGTVINGRNSIDFNGSSFLQVADTNDINLQNQAERSVFMTFQTGADVASRQVLYEQGGQTNGYAIYLFGGNIYTGAWKNNGGDFGFFHMGAVTANTAYAAGFVFDNATTGNYTSYLNGTQIGLDAIPIDQNAHTGDIGIGGTNNDMRHESGGFGGDGLEFTGQIGEILNYDDALTAGEITTTNNYLLTKWVNGIPAGDTISGGAGVDELSVTGDPVVQVMDGTNAIQGVESFDLTGADAAHDMLFTDAYYTGLSGTTVTIDASGISTGINIKGTALSAPNAFSVTGGDGDDTIESGAAGDTLNGGDGDDSIGGAAGDDSLSGGLGDDTIIGGTGNDTLDYSSSASGITANLTSGTVTGEGTDKVSGFEHVVGSDQGDSINGQFSLTETILGGDGADTLTGAQALPAGSVTAGNLVAHLDASLTASITTHPGNVTLWDDQSTRNNDGRNDAGNVPSGTTTMNGLNSLSFDGASHLGINNTNDINTSTYAASSIFVSFETGADITTRQVIYEEGGGTHGMNIYILGGSVYAGAWRDGGGTVSIFLGENINTNTTHTIGFVYDSSGTNTFTAYLDGTQYGSTALTSNLPSHSGLIGIGGQNNASFFGDTGADGGDGVHQFTGEIGELLIYNDALTAGEVTNLNNYLVNKWHGVSGDSILGGVGADELYGGNAVDTLSGGADNDTINAGLGNDCISGGAADDVFVYDDITDSGTGLANRDIISDFNNTTQSDQIDLSGMGSAPFTSVSADGTAGAGVADFTATAAAEVAWEQSAGNTIIYLDDDGDGAADMEIELTGLLSLSGGDFVF